MSIIKKIFVRIIPTKQAKRVKPWFQVNGDKTLRLDYNKLNETSVVFDLGGYEGQWASDIHAKYCSTVYVFEPFPAYAENISTRFRKNPKIKVFPFGLGKTDEIIKLYADNDATSSFKQKGASVDIQIVKASKFIRDQQIGKIDLMKINIEGGEYDLLDELIESDLIGTIGNIQVQFHDFAPNAMERMKKIQKALSRTHRPTYQYEFVWENWERMDEVGTHL
jgi:FkbM family methyltransferase